METRVARFRNAIKLYARRGLVFIPASLTFLSDITLISLFTLCTFFDVECLILLKVMRISRQPSPVTITIDQKQLENVKYFKYLGSMLTDDGRCTCDIKSRIAMAKVAFNKKKNLFTSKLDLNLRKKLVKCYV